MDSSKFGLSLLESLTIGMYTEETVCYREYIQNSCDSINKAVREGVLKFEDSWIDVVIEPENRYVSIEDNGMGLNKIDFYSTMANIAASGKRQGEDMGFRGIGRLIGMAYCKTLKFSASVAGEDVTSIFTWNGEKLTEMLRNNYDGTLEDAIIELIDYSTESADINSRFFKVEMIDVNEVCRDLMEEETVCQYLQFVLPVDYSINFDLATEIHDYAKSLNYHMEEHNVSVNGRNLTKAYYRDLLDKSGKVYDRIESLEFHEFRNKNGELLAWMWYGLSSFEIQIPKENLIRGIALRSSNIQLGDNSVFRNNFNDPRSCFYFVGEVFSVSNGLRPNARRDYFNQNETLNEYIHEIELYFNDVLRKIFNKANDIKNHYKRVNEIDKKIEEHLANLQNGEYSNEKEITRAELELEKAKKEADKARKKLNDVKDLDAESPLGKVAGYIKKRHGADISLEEPKEEVTENTSIPEKTEDSGIPTTTALPTTSVATPIVLEDKTEEIKVQPQNSPQETAPLVLNSPIATNTTTLSPPKEGVTILTPLATDVETVPQEPVIRLFHETLSKLNPKERVVVKELLEIVEETLKKETEYKEIKEKIKKKWN